MNETLQRIIKRHVESYDAIQILKRNHVIDDDLQQEMKVDLLEEIIGVLRGEVED